MKKKLLYVVLLLLCGTIFPLSTYGDEPCTITIDGNKKYVDLYESYEDICPLHDTLCEQYNTSVTCYTEGDDLGEWKSIANACAINVDYGYYAYYIPYGGSYPDVLYPEDGSLCSAGQYLSCDKEGYDFGDWHSNCSSCTITVDGNEEYVDVGESYGSYLYSPDNRSCEPENQPICEYEQDVLGDWYTSCDPNWNTAILETNSDGDYELTYSGTTYIIASGDLAGTYKRGNNTAGNSEIYNGSENNNRWGGGSDNAENGYDSKNPRSERQGPCPSGWHVPSRGEWDAIAIAWCHLSTNNCVAGNLRVDGNGNLDRIRKRGLNTEFKSNFGILNSTMDYYWSSSPNENNTWRFYFGNSNIIGKDSITRDKFYRIRCIKNSTPNFTLTFAASENNGTTSASTGAVESGTVITLSTGDYAATKEGWIHIGWNEDPAATGAQASITMDSDKTVYAIFKKDLTVTYLSGEGVAGIGADSGNCTLYNTGTSCTVVAPNIDLKPGYGTGIWSTGDITKNPGETITLTADDTYTASATPIDYKITYELNGGEVAIANPLSYTIEMEIMLNNPTKDGYTFAGWSGTDLVTPSENVTISKGTTGERSYEAIWQVNEYTITYVLPEGASLAEGVTNPATYTVETDTFTLNNPSKEGWKFNGWTYEGQDEPVSIVTIKKGSTTGNKIFTAVFEEITVPTDPDDVEEFMVPDAGTNASASGIPNVSLDNAEVFTGGATIAELASGATTPQVIIQQWTGDDAIQEANSVSSQSALETTLTNALTDTGMVAKMQGILELQLTYLDGAGNATDMGKVNFSNPVPVFIPVDSSVSGTTEVRADHGDGNGFGTGGLTLYATGHCNADGTVAAADAYIGGAVPVSNNRARIYTCSASSFVAYTETPKPAGNNYGGGGGGGGGSSKTSNKMQEVVLGGEVKVNTGDEAEINTGDENKLEENVKENKNSWCEAGDMSEVSANGYTREMNNAYTFAYNNKITTRNTIEQADMNKPLTRIAMAKMLSYYAINVLGKKPDTSRVNKFIDVSDKLDAQYDNGVTLAYQLGIMGINMKNNEFRPNDYVTRAEFGTALSRMLFGIEDGKDNYYSTHLAKLMKEGIITNDSPTLQELRGYVMIMLMRSACNLGK